MTSFRIVLAHEKMFKMSERGIIFIIGSHGATFDHSYFVWLISNILLLLLLFFFFVDETQVGEGARRTSAGDGE